MVAAKFTFDSFLFLVEKLMSFIAVLAIPRFLLCPPKADIPSNGLAKIGRS